MLEYTIPRFIIQVDDEDFERISQFKWRSTGTGHIKRSGAKPVTLARFLMELPPYVEDKRRVVYKDKNWLNNQKSNLLAISSAELARMNINKNPTSGYYGVSFNKTRNMWWAYVSDHNKNIFAGYAKTAIEAAVLYDKKAVELFGSSTVLNFPLVA